jgi:hypothetical protein
MEVFGNTEFVSMFEVDLEIETHYSTEKTNGNQMILALMGNKILANRLFLNYT